MKPKILNPGERIEFISTWLPRLLLSATLSVTVSIAGCDLLGLTDEDDDDSTQLLALLLLSTTSSSSDGCSYQVQSITTTTSTGNYTLVDTGQTTCYGTNSGTVGCSGGGTAAQDGFYTGNTPSYTNNADGTITDNRTSLMWVNSADTNGDSSINSSDKLTQSSAVSYCSSLTYAGHSDWRLPTVKELYSLMNFGQGRDPSSCTNCASGNLSGKTFMDDSVFSVGFGDTSSGERLIDGQYASTNVYGGKIFDTDTGVFGVNFVDGRIKGYECNSTKTFYVQCVRGNSDYGLNNFTNNGNGTITDNATGLTWQQGDSGTSRTFDQALTYCEGLSLGGSSNWRVPNIKELQSILDYSRAPDYTGSAAINSIFNATSFTNEEGITDYATYWSSTTHVACDNASSTCGGTDDVTSGAYMAFGRALGYYLNSVQDVHGAGSQRSDDKDDVSTKGGAASANVGFGTFFYWGPQGDILRDGNGEDGMYVRCVRN
ncbi:MAG: DUF1566 domain-containing protein [Leptospiraceae bacterium]|nr:DUF1566 domain-containing protein [Leptospiraceae bacterium]MCB1315315.1 DUF1566 domain-containing protein [Leptospiraceae bacterium]